MDFGLNSKTVLVTGGSGAIGHAIAKAFAAEGAGVAVGYHSNLQKADDLATHIKDNGHPAMTVRIDQGDPVSLATGVEQVERTLGPIDVLVANGVTWPTGDGSWDTLVQGLAVNAAGPMMLAEAILPGMRTKGWGRLVFISSDVVDQPMPSGGGYPAAKGALEAAARVLAVREGRNGILTNTVRPGFTETEKAKNSPRLGQAVIDAEAAQTPTGRICTPEDVASAVAYLGSGANSHINGQILSVSGGRELTR